MSERTVTKTVLPADTAATVPVRASRRPCRLFIYSDSDLYELTAHDRETGQFNQKANAALRVLYSETDRSRTEDEIRACDRGMEELAARKRALELRLQARQEAEERGRVIQAAEARLRDKMTARLAQGLSLDRWLHPGMEDVRLVGFGRAKQIAQELQGEKQP